ncbi:autotransporter domain-containing protein [Bartonella sp. LJL80]
MRKKLLKTNVSIVALAISSLTTLAAKAEDITYTGTETEYENLHTDPSAPGERYLYSIQTTTGNTVTINDSTNLAENYKAPNRVFGGISNNSVVNANTVNMTSGKVIDAVIGGYSGDGGSVDRNQVKISGTSLIEGFVYGGFVYQGSGTATNNIVDISGGEVKKMVVGGRSVVGSAVANTVAISADAIVDGRVFGGYADQAGNVSKNNVLITGGVLKDGVRGGLTFDGNATENLVTMSAGNVTGEIHGGHADRNGNASANEVKINGGSASTTIGGYAYNGNAVDNRVAVSDNAVVRDVNGGYVAQAGDARNNQVNISGSARVSSTVKGGFVNSGSGTAANNTVMISGGDISDTVIGGSVADGTAEGNNVAISAGTLRDFAIGGYSGASGTVTGNKVTVKGTALITGTVLGGFSEDGNATNNTVDMQGGTLKFQLYGGRSTTGSVSGNTVYVRGGEVQDNVYGGGADGAGASSNNKVIISGGNFQKQVVGGWSDTGTANLNEVSVSNATIGTSVVAGYVDLGGSDATNNSLSLSGNAYVKGLAISAFTAKGNVTGNKLSLIDAKVDGNVYAGYSREGSVTDNYVTLTGSRISIGGTLYGGYDASNTGDVFTGNTLTLNGFRGDLVGIKNFQNYNWILPKDVVNGETLIHITGTEAVDLQNTIHTIAFVSDGNRLAVGDQVTLIDKVVNTPDSISMEVKQGQFIIYDMRAKQTDQDTFVLTAYNKTVTPEPIDTKDIGTLIDGNGNLSKDTPKLAGRINPQSKAFSEGRAAALGFATQGADLIADTGIRAAQSSVAAASSHITQMNLVPFLVVSGSSSRYKTGSHVDVDGFNMAAGLATGFELAGVHQVTVGAFFEYGRGTYDSYNSFASYASVHGDGDTHYTGGGILGRIDFAGTGLGRVTNLAAGQTDGLYLDAAFRAGKIDTDFDSNDLIDANGVAGSYDSGANYFGAHGSVGYVFNFDDRNSVDVYGRYLWTRVDSETVDVGAERLHFDSTNSSRIRVGTRYSYIYSEQIKPYVGAAYEHEFDGEVKAQAYGLKLDKPSLDGDTGIFEAGISFKPISVNQALSVDVSGQGFVGQREGGGGGMKIKYEF